MSCEFDVSSSSDDELDYSDSIHDVNSSSAESTHDEDSDHEESTAENLDKADEIVNITKDGPRWKNDKLYPPHNKRCSNVSQVWNFGGFRKKDNALDKSEIICGLCGKRIIYRNTPSNFSQHLQSEHVLEWEAHSKKSTSKEQPKISDWASTGASTKPYNKNNMKQKKFRNQLSQWVIKNLRPISIVKDQEFVDLISIADPKLKVPSNTTLGRDITKKYNLKKKQFLEDVKDVKYLSGTTDAGSSYAGTNFININVHWVSEDFEVRKKMLDIIEATSKTLEDYRATIDGTFEQK